MLNWAAYMVLQINDGDGPVCPQVSRTVWQANTLVYLVCEISIPMPKTPMTVQIVPADFQHPAAQTLVQELDAYLRQQYPDYEAETYGLKAKELIHARSGFWLAYWGAVAVGCVAVRPHTPLTAELKRMYVQPLFRGRGVGCRLLQTAIAAAIDWRYEQIVLETGVAQPESIRLYERYGFQPIPCFGRYTDPESLCYQKRLAQG